MTVRILLAPFVAFLSISPLTSALAGSVHLQTNSSSLPVLLAQSEDDNMYEALEAEANRQKAMDELGEQIDGPLRKFQDRVSQSLESRNIDAQKRIDDIMDATSCRLDAVKSYINTKGYFLKSDTLDKARKDIAALQDELLSKSPVDVEFTSDDPPDFSAEVRSFVDEATNKIKSIAQDFDKTCQDNEAAIGQLQTTQGKEMMRLTQETQDKNAQLSDDVKRIVDDLNHKVGELDKKLADWAVEPLRNAKPRL